jgi:uncharacterized protein (TIGR01655 family)
MKRSITLLSLLVIITTMLVGCNRMGKDQYYVQITTNGTEKIAKVDNEKFISYEYNLPGFDKDGNEKEMQFRADKNLRSEAFLRIYYSDKKGVTSWEEVKEDELPAKVKDKLDVK